jgi:hypothetical protein
MRENERRSEMAKTESLPVQRTKKKCYPLKVALCGTQNHEVISDYDLRQAARNVMGSQAQWRECEAQEELEKSKKKFNRE